MRIINITDINYPNSLLSISNPPKRLYAEGNTSLLSKLSVAIVGSRNSSVYGNKYASLFAEQLSKNRICVISGLAIGIDTIAHQYSMQLPGRTIGVIGSGFKNIYPQENIALANKILNNNGCLLSEYPPDCIVNMNNFPKRNRIICGLSVGILVIEAKACRSGSTITANLGLKNNKKVFCLPRNIDDPNR